MKLDIICKALESIKNDNNIELENINKELKKINIDIKSVKCEISNLNNENKNVMNIENFTFDYKNMVMLYIYILVIIFLIVSIVLEVVGFNIPFAIVAIFAFYKVSYSFCDYIPRINSGNSKSSFFKDLKMLFVSKKKLANKKKIINEQLDILNKKLDELLELLSERISMKDKLEDELSYVDGNMVAVNKLNTKYNIHDIKDDSEVVKFINKKKVLELK